MNTQKLISKPVEFAYTDSTNQAAALLALGVPLRKKDPAVRIYTERRPPGTTGEVTYFFKGTSDEFPKTKARSVIGEMYLATPRGQDSLEGRETADKELDKVITYLGEAIRSQNFNNAQGLFQELAKWLPLGVAIYIQNALIQRDALMKDWVFDSEKLPAFTREQNGSVVQVRGQNLDPENAALLNQ